MYMKVGALWYEVNPKGWYEAKIDDMDPDIIAKKLAEPGRKDPLGKGVDIKSIGSRRKTSTDKDIVAALKQAIRPGRDKKSYDRAVKAWKTVQAKTREDFKALVNQLANKDLTKNQFINRSRVVFKNAYEKAYRLGTDASGLNFLDLPDEDMRWLQRVRSHEYKFLDKFADDIIAGRGSIPYETRADMYVDSIDSIFDAARVDAYPNEGTSIWWELGTTEHCGDCIDLAYNSPYRPDTLPTTPKAGATKCLSNCDCTLRVRYEYPKEIVLDMEPVPSDKAKELGLIGLALVVMNKIGSRRVVDWNELDNAVSALTEMRMSKEKVRDVVTRVETQRNSLFLFEEACSRLPNWFNPYGEDLLYLHKVGGELLRLRYAGGVRDER